MFEPRHLEPQRGIALHHLERQFHARVEVIAVEFAAQQISLERLGENQVLGDLAEFDIAKLRLQTLLLARLETEVRRAKQCPCQETTEARA